MRITVPLALLSVLSPLQGFLSPLQAQDPAQDPAAPTAREVFESAVAAQGRLDPDDIHDLYVKFVGQVKEKGHKTQSAEREYWLRPGDRSFRIKTTAGADPAKPYSERGVLGSPKERYWEWVRKGRAELRRTNREHRKNILAIRRDRKEFERIVRMVLLVRITEDDAAISFANPGKVRLVKDQPNSARHILGEDRKAEYHVLNIARKGADPLRFFVRIDDSTVRKVIQYDRATPDKIKSVSYFGYYRKNDAAEGMVMPQAFSVYSAVPDGKDRNKATMKVSGRLSVRINGNLGDETFSPGEPKK